MNDAVTISRNSCRSKAGRWRRRGNKAPVVFLAAMSLTFSACSTLKGSSEGTWNASYFTDPDRVWDAMEIALIDLDYEVVSENRSDGVIRASSVPTDDGTVIALAIDQVMRTEDQVHIYVKPSFGGDGDSNNPDLLKKAAEQFLKAVGDTLGQ